MSFASLKPHQTCTWVMLLVAALFSSPLGCDSSRKDTAPPSTDAKSANKAQDSAADKGVQGDAKPDTDQDTAAGSDVKVPARSERFGPDGAAAPDGFDPLEACANEAFDAKDIPPVPLRALLAQDDAVELELSLVFKTGRVNATKDRVMFSFSSEALKDCSGFRADGGLARQPQLGVRVAKLEPGSFYFPTRNPEEPPGMSYWNYTYTTDKKLPRTLKSVTAEDSGAIIIEEVINDPETNIPTASGRVLLCKARGEKGWAVGRFEVPVCGEVPVLKDNDAAPDGAAPGEEVPAGDAPGGDAPGGDAPEP